MKKIIAERRLRVNQNDLVKVTDDLVRDFAEFSSYMMNDEYVY